MRQIFKIENIYIYILFHAVTLPFMYAENMKNKINKKRSAKKKKQPTRELKNIILCTFPTIYIYDYVEITRNRSK